jgi:hypothetical protein
LRLVPRRYKSEGLPLEPDVPLLHAWVTEFWRDLPGKSRHADRGKKQWRRWRPKTTSDYIVGIAESSNILNFCKNNIEIHSLPRQTGITQLPKEFRREF